MPLYHNIAGLPTDWNWKNLWWRVVTLWKVVVAVNQIHSAKAPIRDIPFGKNVSLCHSEVIQTTFHLPLMRWWAINIAIFDNTRANTTTSSVTIWLTVGLWFRNGLSRDTWDIAKTEMCKKIKKNYFGKLSILINWGEGVAGFWL